MMGEQRPKTRGTRCRQDPQQGLSIASCRHSGEGGRAQLLCSSEWIHQISHQGPQDSFQPALVRAEEQGMDRQEGMGMLTTAGRQRCL